MNHLRKNYMKLIGKKLKALKIQTKHIQRFYKSLLSCMIITLLKKDQIESKRSEKALHN